LDAKIDLMMLIDSLIILVESLIAGIIAVNIKDKRVERTRLSTESHSDDDT